MAFLKRFVGLCVMSAVLMAPILFVGCGDDGGGGSDPDLIVLSDFEGSWAAASYRVTSAVNSQITLELVEMGGAFGWDADDEGEFTGRGFIPAALAGMSLEMPFQGSFEIVTQESITVSFIPEYPPFLTETRSAFTLVGNTFTIRDDNTEFDFDGDQQMEPAIFEGTMVRYPGGAPTVVFLEDFEGFWEAETYRVTSATDPQTTIEVISLGATFEFSADDAGAIVGDAFIPASVAGQDVLIEDFTAAFSLVNQDTIQIAFVPEFPPFLTSTYGGFALVQDTLNIVDPLTYFDFDGDQVPEEAIFEGKMVRTSTK
jgi:hypothetical protein